MIIFMRIYTLLEARSFAASHILGKQTHAFGLGIQKSSNFFFVFCVCCLSQRQRPFKRNTIFKHKRVVRVCRYSRRRLCHYILELINTFSRDHDGPNKILARPPKWALYNADSHETKARQTGLELGEKYQFQNVCLCLIFFFASPFVCNVSVSLRFFSGFVCWSVVFNVMWILLPNARELHCT